MKCANTLRWLGFAAAAYSATASSTPDAVVLMCQDVGKPEAVCTCAAEALRISVAKEAYALYEGVGVQYRDNQATGMDRAYAWMVALDINGASLNQINPVGAAHRKAITACSE